MSRGKEMASSGQSFRTQCFFIFCICGVKGAQHSIPVIPHMILHTLGVNSWEPRVRCSREKSNWPQKVSLTSEKSQCKVHGICKTLEAEVRFSCNKERGAHSGSRKDSRLIKMSAYLGHVTLTSKSLFEFSINGMSKLWEHNQKKFPKM